MGRALALIVVLSSGCNLLLGLDPTSVGDDDDDGPDASSPDGAGPDGHDEDDDRIADHEDVCPHVADPDQLDDGEAVFGLDPDGVGDACDPHPDAPGDQLVWFDPFTDVLVGEYAIPKGTWRVEDDVLRQTAEDLGSDEARIMIPGQHDAIVLEASIEVDAVGAAADSLRGLGLWVAAAESPAPRPAGVLCIVVIDQQNQVAGMYGVHVSETGKGSVVGSALAPGDPRTGTWTLRATLEPTDSGATVTCWAETGGLAQSFTFVEATYTAGRAGVHVDGLAVTLPYLVAYGRGSD